MLPLQERTRELWAEHNPDLDTSPMEVVALVKRVTAVLDRAVEPIYETASLTSAEAELLVPLRYAPEPVTAARLADRLGMSRAGVSKTLAKLDKRGLVTRSVNPADRRAALISTTSAGRELIDEVFPRELRAHARLLAGLGDDRSTIVAALTRFAESMEQQLDADSGR